MQTQQYRWALVPLVGLLLLWQVGKYVIRHRTPAARAGDAG